MYLDVNFKEFICVKLYFQETNFIRYISHVVFTGTKFRLDGIRLVQNYFFHLILKQSLQNLRSFSSSRGDYEIGM